MTRKWCCFSLLYNNICLCRRSLELKAFWNDRELTNVTQEYLDTRVLSTGDVYIDKCFRCSLNVNNFRNEHTCGNLKKKPEMDWNSKWKFIIFISLRCNNLIKLPNVYVESYLNQRCKKNRCTFLKQIC